MTLLTGSSGFLGKKVVEKLAGNFEFKEFEGDLTKKITLTEKFETVIHMAGATDRNKLVMSTNEVMAENVVNWAKKNEVKRIIFVSSNSVNYSQREYAVTKKKAEEIIIESGVEYTIIRPAIIFGKGSKDIEMTIERTKYLPVIPLPGGKTGKGTPIYVDDVAEFILKVLENENITKNKIVSIGGPETLTNHQVMELIEEAKGWKKPIIDLPANLVCWMNRVYYQSLNLDISVDNTRAKIMFDWEPRKLTASLLIS